MQAPERSIRDAAARYSHWGGGCPQPDTQPLTANFSPDTSILVEASRHVVYLRAIIDKRPALNGVCRQAMQPLLVRFMSDVTGLELLQQYDLLASMLDDWKRAGNTAYAVAVDHALVSALTQARDQHAFAPSRSHAAVSVQLGCLGAHKCASPGFFWFCLAGSCKGGNHWQQRPDQARAHPAVGASNRGQWHHGARLVQPRGPLPTACTSLVPVALSSLPSHTHHVWGCPFGSGTLRCT